MNIKKPIYIGIDFCNTYTQYSYYDFGQKDAVSYSEVPTVVSLDLINNVFLIGKDAIKNANAGEGIPVYNILEKIKDRNPVIIDNNSYMPADLAEIFLAEILKRVKQEAAVEEIEGICITLEEFHITILNTLSLVLEKMGLRDKVTFISHMESFVYFALSQKTELCKNDVVMFEYDKAGLKARILNVQNYRGQRIVVTEERDYSDTAPYSLAAEGQSLEYFDKRISQCAQDFMGKRNISSVYLTGSVFADDFSAPGFVKIICDRRKAFAGQNMYVKGACYQAFETKEGIKLKDYTLACNERITTGIELKVSEFGKDKILRIVRPGENWYGADCSYDLIVDEAEELEFFLSPVDTMEKQIVRVSLKDFPKRAPRTTRITVKLSFTSEKRCHLLVIDKGFGEFFQSSGRIISEEILL